MCLPSPSVDYSPRNRYFAERQQAYLPNFPANNTSDPRAITLDNYNQNDAFYVASANFTNRTSLPPWTSQHYYFLPSLLNANLPNDGSVKVTLQATGFGADLDCQGMTTTPSDAMYAISFNPNATLLSFMTSTVLSDGSIAQCTTFGGATGPGPSKNYLSLAGNPQGRTNHSHATPAQQERDSRRPRKLCKSYR
jgi:hypothetical protein